MQIMQEKEQFLQERAKQTQARSENLRSIEAEKKRLESYRRRVRNWVKPYVAHLKNELAAISTRAEVLGAQAAGRDATIGDLRARLNETIVHCQNLEKSRNKDQSKLVDQYEERIQLIETELEKARGELRRTRDKSTRVDEVSKTNAELENRIVLLERRKFESESRLGIELREFQEQVTTYRVEAKTLASELISTKQTAETLQAENQQVKGELAQLQDQFESLQIVWADTQKKLETARIQSESLGRLNQELGRLLKEERRTRENTAANPTRPPITNSAVVAVPLNTAPHHQASTDGLSTEERNQQLIEQINNRIVAKPIADPKSGKQMPDFIETEGERFAKIDNLLAELESGFSMMEHEGTEAVRNLDILED
jgi:chromosome segregation ATPase